MRKGIASQVFIYIFAIIVIAFILYFGFTQIVNLKNLSEKSDYVAFKSDFEKAVNDIYYKNPGSVLEFSMSSRNKPLELPKDIKEVCFNNEGEVNLGSLEYDKFTVEHLRKGENLQSNGCIEVNNGRLSFKLENVAEDEDTFVEVNSIE